MRRARLTARGGAGLGQQELAELLGVSQAAISDYERGRRRPGLEALVDLSRHLGVDAGWLLTGNAPERPGGVREDVPATQVTRPAPTTVELLRANLSELMGVSALPHHGSVGLLEGGALRWAVRSGRQGDGVWPDAREASDDDTNVPLAAEHRAGYGRAGPVDPGGELRGAAFVFDRALAYGAEALADYEGPAAGPFIPGDVLLLAYADGYPGIRVFRRSSGTAAPGAAEMAIEPAGVSARVTTGPRVVALLRQL